MVFEFHLICAHTVITGNMGHSCSNNLIIKSQVPLIADTLKIKANLSFNKKLDMLQMSFFKWIFLSKHFLSKYQCSLFLWVQLTTHIARFMGPTWGPPGSCRPQMGPILAPWTLLSGNTWWLVHVMALVQTGNKSLPEPMAFQFCDSIWHQYDLKHLLYTFIHNEFWFW